MGSHPRPAASKASGGAKVLRGVVAMIDALGFKGAWGNADDPSTEVLDSLKRIRTAAQVDIGEAKLRLRRGALPDEVVRLVKEPDVKIVQLSDTIVVAAGRRQRLRSLWTRHTLELEKLGLDEDGLDQAVDGYLRYLVCKCICGILKTAALCKPTVVYRGTLTAGTFAIDETENFLLGPAVDEAASLMNIADGPFVWLSPTAKRLPHGIRDTSNDLWERMTLKYKVPLKGGQRLRSRVLNPFAFCSAKEHREARHNILVKMNVNQLDVAVKHGNAIDLFDAIKGKEEIAAWRAKRKKEKEKEAS